MATHLKVSFPVAEWEALGRESTAAAKDALLLNLMIISEEWDTGCAVRLTARGTEGHLTSLGFLMKSQFIHNVICFLFCIWETALPVASFHPNF